MSTIFCNTDKENNHILDTGSTSVSLKYIQKVLDKHNRSEMVAVLGPLEALPYYIHISKRCRIPLL
jgi:hypothetical protein